MSESDSDLDFESADEDAEFVSTIKDDRLSKSTKQPPVKSSPPHTDPPTQKNESVTETETKIKDKSSDSIDPSPTTESEVNVQDEIEKVNEQIKEAHISCHDIKQKQSELMDTKDDSTEVDQNKALKDVVSIAADNKPQVSTDTKDDSLEMDQNKAKKDLTSIVSDKLPEVSTEEKSVSSEFQVEKPRVLLRIEKKKQQKSQFCKEASVEKASDLVNILREEPKPQPTSSWGFSSWGSSLLSTAASSVSTFSSQVTQGFGTVLETVESTLGAPPPEELASTLNEIKKNLEEKGKDESQEEKTEDKNQESKSENEAITGLLPDVSSWTKVLENTGSKVLFGGLDTLELIGKKTMDMLTEGDPGLRKKRAVFSDKVNIAELLREARAKAEEQDKKDGLQQDTVHYSQVFDEKQGIVHLEALEMLSNQSQVKLQRLLMRHSKNTEVKKRLEEIKLICEDMPSVDDQSDCENFEDFETVFKKHALELNLPVNVENILKVQRQISDNITKYENISEESKLEGKEVFHAAIYSLAEFTAKCIETFHKISELIIVQPLLQTDIEHCVTNLTGLAAVVCIEVNNISTKYHKCLESATKSQVNSTSSEDLNITTMATNLYVEAANSNKYIQDAYLMLVPVLQVCLLENLD